MLLLSSPLSNSFFSLILFSLFISSTLFLFFFDNDSCPRNHFLILLFSFPSHSLSTFLSLSLSQSLQPTLGNLRMFVSLRTLHRNELLDWLLSSYWYLLVVGAPFKWSYYSKHSIGGPWIAYILSFKSSHTFLHTWIHVWIQSCMLSWVKILGKPSSRWSLVVMWMIWCQNEQDLDKVKLEVELP